MPSEKCLTSPSVSLISIDLDLPFTSVPVYMASSFGIPTTTPPPSLPPEVNPLQDIELPSGSPEKELPLGGCSPFFKCPKGNNPQLGGCTIDFRCN